MKTVPFCIAWAVNTPGPAAPAGYLMKVRGIFVSVPPLNTVTGPGVIEIGGVAAPVPGAGGLVFGVLPSTTEVVNLPPLIFSEGVEAVGPGPSCPLTLTYTPNGSDSDPSLTVNVWGVLEPV